MMILRPDAVILQVHLSIALDSLLHACRAVIVRGIFRVPKHYSCDMSASSSVVAAMHGTVPKVANESKGSYAEPLHCSAFQ